MRVTAETITDEQIQQLARLNIDLWAWSRIAADSRPHYGAQRAQARDELAAAWNARHGGS